MLTVVGQPGLHHNFLRFILDYSSKLTPEIKGHPFTDTGTSHADIKYSGKFARIQGRCVTEDDIGPFVMPVADDILYFERASMAREGDRDNDLYDYENFESWQPWNSDYISNIREEYNIKDRDSIPKFVLRDSVKKSYLDVANKGHTQENIEKVDALNKTEYDNYFFPVTSFFVLDKFMDELQKLDAKYGLDLDLDMVEPMHKMFVSHNRILQTHHLTEDVLTSLEKQENITIPRLDIFQEAYIYATIEQKHNNILMPLVKQFFDNTKEIMDYIKYYPQHYKIWNPNLPK